MNTPRLRLLGLGALCLTSSLLHGQQPNLQPARLLPGTPVLGPAAGTQRTPALSRGAGATLMVFEDNRAGDSDLFAVRLDAAGAALETLPFPITKAPGNQSAPKVCWSGSQWLVVYSNQVDPGSGYFAYEVAAQRVSASGQVLDATPIALTEDDTGGGFAVASDGNGWAVLTTGYSGGNSAIVARRIGANGSLLDPTGVVIEPATFHVFFGLSAAFVQGRYVFSWTDDGTWSRRFDAALLPVDASARLLSSLSGAPVSNGTQLLLAATRQTPLFTSEVVAQRFDGTLNALDASPLAVSGFAADEFHADPRATWDGTRWIVGWTTFGQQIGKAARITSAGVVLDPGGVTIPESNPGVLYAWTLGGLANGGALLAWEDARFGTALDVYATPLFGDGTPGSERNYSRGSEALGTPRVAAGEDQYLVVFRAERGDGSRVLAQRVDAFGNALDLEPLEVASAPHARLTSGGAAWNGALYLVTWSDGLANRTYARRLTSDGAWLDAAPIEVLVGTGADVAALGQDFFVTALDAPSYPQFVYAFGARVRGGDGAVLDDPAQLVGQSFATRARVATLGGRWLVATESHWSHDETPAGVQLTFVDASGLVTSSGGLGVFNIQDRGSIDLASAGTSVLVVVPSGSNWTNTEVWAQRILPDGSVSAPSVLLTGGDGMGQFRPSVVWTGSEYLVTYQTYQSNRWFYDFEPDVFGVRVSESGALLDAHGFALWNGEDHEVWPDAASLGDGRALVAVSSYVDAEYAATRIALRGLRPAGLRNFGLGTPGCDGPQRMDANGEPFGGNAAFVLRCDRAPAGTIGGLLMSTGGDAPGSDPLGLGLLVHVDMLASFVQRFPFVTDALGKATLLAPIPAIPVLYGRSFYFQAGFRWSGPCTPSPLGWSTTDGLELVLQAP